MIDRTNKLLGFVETETGVYATYNRRGEIQSKLLKLSAIQHYGKKNLTFYSHMDLLESLTDNKVHKEEYLELIEITMGYFESLLFSGHKSSDYDNMAEKIEEVLLQQKLIEEMGLDPKKINVGLTEIEPFCYGEFGSISVEREDGVAFALGVFREIFSWIECCISDKEFKEVELSPEYKYMVTENPLLPCVFTQFGLENYVKEWKIKEYLKDMFIKKNCFEVFKNDFIEKEKN